MKVFISWSGKRSKETADVLSSWIRQVIQAAETWISLDIEKGTRWNDKINKELEQTKIGIICLNKDNLTSEWILFEAGALSKTSDAQVCTLLLDVNPADIKPPLGQFQHTLFTKDDIKKLIHSINNKIISQDEKTLPEKDLDEVFEVFWPKLEEKLNTIKSKGSEVIKQSRTDRDILEEILQVVRANYKTYSFADYQKLLDTLSSNLYCENFDDKFKNTLIRYYLYDKPNIADDEFYKIIKTIKTRKPKQDKTDSDKNEELDDGVKV